MPERSTTITADLLRRMIRDAAIVRLTTRSALIVWAAVVVLLVLGVVLAVAPGDRGSAATPFVMAIVFAVLFPPLLFWNTRRALTAALPVGSTAEAEVGDESLRVATARGSSDARYSAYRAVVERPSVVLLRLRGSQIVNVIPRELLDEADIARLRERIAAAVTAPRRRGAWK